MSADDAVASLAAHEQSKHLPASKLAARRTELEAEIYRAIRRFEEETGFGVKEVRVGHPVRGDDYEAVRWREGPVEVPLPCSVACSLYSSVMKGSLFSEPGEIDVTHLLPDAGPTTPEAVKEALRRADEKAVEVQNEWLAERNAKRASADAASETGAEGGRPV